MTNASADRKIQNVLAIKIRAKVSSSGYISRWDINSYNKDFDQEFDLLA
jgi:hypothetical protein